MTEKREERLKEAFNYLKSKGIVHMQKDVAIQINAPGTSVSRAFKGHPRYLTDSFLHRFNSAFGGVFNDNWLLIGEGEMLNKEGSNNVVDIANRLIKNKISGEYSFGGTPKNTKGSLSINYEYNLVPQVRVEVSDTNIMSDENIIDIVPFKDAQANDRCIQVVGNDMFPTCPAGSIILIREVSNWRNYFGYDSIFTIILDDGRKLIKRVRQHKTNPKEFIVLESENPAFPAVEELPKDMIIGVWKVVAVISKQSW